MVLELRQLRHNSLLLFDHQSLLQSQEYYMSLTRGPVSSSDFGLFMTKDRLDCQ